VAVVAGGGSKPPSSAKAQSFLKSAGLLKLVQEQVGDEGATIDVTNESVALFGKMSPGALTFDEFVLLVVSWSGGPAAGMQCCCSPYSTVRLTQLFALELLAALNCSPFNCSPFNCSPYSTNTSGPADSGWQRR